MIRTLRTKVNTQIRQHIGAITGEAIIGAHVLRDFMASITDFVGHKKTVGYFAEKRYNTHRKPCFE